MTATTPPSLQRTVTRMRRDWSADPLMCAVADLIAAIDDGANDVDTHAAALVVARAYLGEEDQ